MLWSSRSRAFLTSVLVSSMTQSISRACRTTDVSTIHMEAEPRVQTLRLSMSSRCSLRYGVLRLVLRVCPFQVGRPTAREASCSGAGASANG